MEIKFLLEEVDKGFSIFVRSKPADDHWSLLGCLESHLLYLEPGQCGVTSG